MDIFKSKKFWVLVGGMLGIVLNKYLDIAPEATAELTGVVIAYLLGQGLADVGKEKEKISGI